MMRRVGGELADEADVVERVSEVNGENINSSSESVCDADMEAPWTWDCGGVWRRVWRVGS